MKRIIAISALAAMLSACQGESGLKLSPVFADGMILKQQSLVTLSGNALPGRQVAFAADWGISVSAVADVDTRWSVEIPVPPADFKPHEIVFETNDTTIIIRNVMFGEVWLASGQSNMEMPLSGWPTDSIQYSAESIAASADSLLRFFTVDKRISLQPEIDTPGRWVNASPATAGQFSATAYFFARMLRDSLQVPVGILSAYWGGTPIEAWIRSECLADDVDFASRVTSPKQAAEELNAHFEWLASLPNISTKTTPEGDDPLTSICVGDEYVSQAEFKYDDWDEMNLPGYWETDSLGEFDGIVWFVKTVNIPDAWLNKELTMYLGAIDDRDVTYVNGIQIGTHHSATDYNVPRIYKIPASLTKRSQLTIAVRVLDSTGNGGFTGCDGGMRIERNAKDKLPINGPWKYRVAGEFYADNLAIFDLSQNQFASHPRPTMPLTVNTATVLFNAMIYPLSGVPVSGVIWYQGEANVGRANQYARLMERLADSWHMTFNDNNLPFLFAQIAPWSYSDPDGASSANIREAQRRAADKINGAAMISTLDLGSPLTIHPCYKKPVGERLAQLALKQVYGNDSITALGPVLSKAEAAGQLFVLEFDNADGLHIDFDKPNLFEIAGDDGEYYTATALAKGNKVTLFSHAVPKPVAVRYAHKNYVDATLFNGAGLPAPSFSTQQTLDD